MPRKTALVASGSFTPVQFGHLARRAALRTLRQPTIMLPNLGFPLIFFGVLAGGVQAAGGISGFPTDSYTDFAFTAPFIQGVLLCAIITSTLLARDIEMGFLDRLLLTPVRSIGILAGHLAGAAAVALCQCAVFIAIGLALGVTFESGVAGVIVLVLFVMLVTVGFGGIGVFVALRTGSAEAVQGLFPILFALMFLSSLTLPRDLIDVDWFRAVATVNPVSYLIEGIRSLIIEGWDAAALARGFAVLAGLLVIGMGSATLGLRSRVVRT